MDQNPATTNKGTSISDMRTFRKGDQIHMDTKNESFKLTSDELHKQGVSKYDHMLWVDFPALKNIDPYSENLSALEIDSIMSGCTSMWYFLREILKVPDVNGQLIPYHLNRGQAAFLALSNAGFSSWRTPLRQDWNTTTNQAFLLYKFLFDASKMITVVCRSQAEVRTWFERFNELFKGLPDYLKMRFDQEIDLNKSDRRYIELRNRLRHNVIRVETFKDEDEVKCYTRGRQYGYFLIEDAEHVPHLQCIVQETRYRTKGPYMICGSYGECENPEINFITDMIEGGLKWHDYMYNTEEAELQRILKEYTNDMVYIKYHYHQLRRDEAWRAKAMKDTMNRCGEQSICKRELLLIRC